MPRLKVKEIPIKVEEITSVGGLLKLSDNVKKDIQETKAISHTTAKTLTKKPRTQAQIDAFNKVLERNKEKFKKYQIDKEDEKEKERQEYLEKLEKENKIVVKVKDKVKYKERVKEHPLKNKIIQLPSVKENLTEQSESESEPEIVQNLAKQIKKSISKIEDRLEHHVKQAPPASQQLRNVHQEPQGKVEPIRNGLYSRLFKKW